MHHTSFSFRKATGSPEQVVERLAELGYTHAPIADFNNTFAWVRWSEACKKHGLKPIFGVSLNVVPLIEAKKPVTDVWNFYAIDDVKPLNDLVRKAYSQGRSLPRIGFRPLIKYSDIAKIDNLICVSGYRARLEHMNPEQSNVYVGLQPASAKGFVQSAIDGGFKLFATQDARYVMPEDRDFYQITCGYDADLRTWPQWILNHEEFAMQFPEPFGTTFHTAFRHSINNRSTIFAQCTAELKKGDLIRPQVDKTLEQMCREGAIKLGLSWADEYETRLQEELKTIHDKKFEDYFFLVADLMQWAKKNMMVGPGRGSSAGSLVCYLLGITQVDPIEYGLLFFRFLSPDRPDWPDIDGDFANRDAAIDYLVEKYGVERVAKLGTTGNFMVNNSTDDVAKQLRLPRFEFDNLLNSLPDYAANDKRQETKLAEGLHNTAIGKKILDKYPKFELAGMLAGNPKNAATHASGVVLTNDEISNYVAVNTVTNTTTCDMVDAEKLNLLKLDVLGLITLTIMEEALRIAGLDPHHLDTLELNDQKAFDIINNQAFFGVFQFDKTVAGLSKEMKVDRFSDIVALLSLGRPGPLSSGAAHRWLKKRMGIIPVEYPHELLKPYLEETFGELVFQEQSMLIAREVAGMDWTAVSKLRKAIGKSQGDEALAEHKQPFVSGLINAGLTDNEAEGFWNELKGFGSYGFNKSHAVCYAVVAYWTCWLKAYYPLEFTAACLTAANKKEKQIEFLREMKAEGVDYVPFDIEHSTDKWTVATKGDKKILVGPLQNVKGLGVKSVMQILGARARGEAIPDSLQKKLTNAKTDLDNLYPIRQAINGMDWQSHVNGRLTNLNKALPTNNWEPYEVIGLVTKCEEQSENDAKKVADRLSRGQQGILPGDPKSIQIRLRNDDTTDFLCKVTTKQLDVLRDYVIEKVQVGKSIVVVRGKTVPNVPCLLVNEIEVIGEM